MYWKIQRTYFRSNERRWTSHLPLILIQVELPSTIWPMRSMLRFGILSTNHCHCYHRHHIYYGVIINTINTAIRNIFPFKKNATSFFLQAKSITNWFHNHRMRLKQIHGAQGFFFLHFVNVLKLNNEHVPQHIFSLYLFWVLSPSSLNNRHCLQWRIFLPPVKAARPSSQPSLSFFFTIASSNCKLADR